jgi:hypothetical protein
MPLYLKAGTSSLLRVGTSLASNSACCCAGCVCTCQPSTVTFTASAVSFYTNCCECTGGPTPSGSIYLTIPAMTSVTAYKCCDVSAPGSENIRYASNPILLGTFNLLDTGDIFCSNSKSTTIYAQISIGSANCASSSWVAEVRLFGYYSPGACSSVLIPLDRSIDPCDTTGINDCLLGCFASGGISQSNTRTANFCSPTGTYTFTPLATAVSATNCNGSGAGSSDVNWTLVVA